MRCLLDKVTARYAIQGLLKLATTQELTSAELFTLDFFARAKSQPACQLFIAPPTANVLQRLIQLPAYSSIIQLFLEHVEIAFPTRYFKRWAAPLTRLQLYQGRCRDIGFGNFRYKQRDCFAKYGIGGYF